MIPDDSDLAAAVLSNTVSSGYLAETKPPCESAGPGRGSGFVSGGVAYWCVESAPGRPPAFWMAFVFFFFTV